MLKNTQAGCIYGICVIWSNLTKLIKTIKNVFKFANKKMGNQKSLDIKYSYQN